jgi:hypothetical protein
MISPWGVVKSQPSRELPFRSASAFSDYKVFFEYGHEVLGEIYPSSLSPFGCVRQLACREIALDPQTALAQVQILGP